MIEQFKFDLKKRLGETLPAHAAHQKLMKHRPAIEEIGQHVTAARKSAVLLLLYPKHGKLHLVFIQRPIYKGVHSGQIGFPGGKSESFDQNLKATAFREAEEELDIKPSKLEVLGELSPLYIPPSNFVVQPFVALQDHLPLFKADPIEVSSVIECPLEYFTDHRNLTDTFIKKGREKLQVKAFCFQGKVIWGATAMIIKEFIEAIEGITLPSELK